MFELLLSPHKKARFPHKKKLQKNATLKHLKFKIFFLSIVFLKNIRN
jgi:hypothetical protein